MASGNGKRTPPRPKIEIEAAGASPDEAAAIAAALELFLVETAPAPKSPDAANRWQRAALVDAVEARRFEPTGWGPAVPG